MSRQAQLEYIRKHYDVERLKSISTNNLHFEEVMVSDQDLDCIRRALDQKLCMQNPHNSIILYLLKITNQFDFQEGRIESIGGSSPDIDLDWPNAERDRLVEIMKARWGEERVARIGTLGTFKPKSLTKRYFSIYEQPDYEVLSKIPKGLFGKEATLKEIIEGNPEKGYIAHPELTADKYLDWYNFASRLENMVSNFGIHAAGVILSELDISDYIPLRTDKKYGDITQYEMHIVEELGFLKYDFLVIKNLDVIIKAIQLVKERHGIDIDLYAIPDGDKNAYSLFGRGLLTGIFQFETSLTIKDLAMKAKPTSIEELSDISSICRPGPLSAGFDKQYVDNKANLKPPDKMPASIRKVLKDTYYVLIYQETVMQMLSDIAGFSLQSSDNVRRALAKKDLKKMLPYKQQWIEQSQAIGGLDIQQAEEWWEIFVGCSDYLFNRSHSVFGHIIFRDYVWPPY